MTKIKVVDYNPEHKTRIKPKAIHAGSISPEIKTRAISLISEDTVLAIFGGSYIAAGVFHIWGIVSEDVRRCPLSFHKTARELLQFFEKKEKPRRIQIDTRVSHADLCHWAEALGFRREGVMKAYESDGEDCWLFAKVRPHGVR